MTPSLDVTDLSLIVTGAASHDKIGKAGDLVFEVVNNLIETVHFHLDLLGGGAAVYES